LADNGLPSVAALLAPLRDDKILLMAAIMVLVVVVGTGLSSLYLPFSPSGRRSS
jgi:hypothetical protein